MRRRLPNATFEAMLVLGVLTVALAGSIAGITVWLVNYDHGDAVAAVTSEAATTEPATETTAPETTAPEATTAEETAPAETTAGGQGDAAAGAEVFADVAGCGGCHTLAAAGSTGNVGPNLDDSKPSYDLVVERVTHGAGAMPAFGDNGTLDEQQIADVAAYVVESTS